jgi:hypothetical protein
MGGATTGLYNINEPLKQALQLNESTQLTGMLAQVQKYLSAKESVFDIPSAFCEGVCMKSEIIFEVTEAEEGGFCASALGYGINTQAENLEELRAQVRDAVAC